MNLKDIKDIMKQVNEPNEFELYLFDSAHPLYWICKVENVRVKMLFQNLESLRKPFARFDVFINGLLIAEYDYVFETIENDFYIKFKKANFPQFDRFGNPYQIEESDEIKVHGDLEKIIKN
jgi:hypothetical protein